MSDRSNDDPAAGEGLKNALTAERQIDSGSNVRASWEALIKEARGCTRCDLYRLGTRWGRLPHVRCWERSSPSAKCAEIPSSLPAEANAG
jgi:hypothetical protein